jgi:hypothetical protein
MYLPRPTFSKRLALFFMYVRIVGNVQLQEAQSALVVTVAPTIVLIYVEILVCFDIILSLRLYIKVYKTMIKIKYL